MSTHPDLDEAKAWFREAGLAFPPVPAELEGRFFKRGRHRYSTAPFSVEPYDFAAWASGGALPVDEDFLLLAHDGHGLNSFALHYYLARGPLRLFLQLAWGGVYMGVDKTIEASECFAAVEGLLHAAAAAERAGRLRSEAPLVVVASNYSRQLTVAPGLTGEQRTRMAPAAVLKHVTRFLSRRK